jgi:hypothetical protein
VETVGRAGYVGLYARLLNRRGSSFGKLKLLTPSQ